VRRVNGEAWRVRSIELRDGSIPDADWYVAAVSFDRLLDLLWSEWIAQHSCFSNAKHLETSPSSGVHQWYHRPVMDLALRASRRSAPADTGAC